MRILMMLLMSLIASVSAHAALSCEGLFTARTSFPSAMTKAEVVDRSADLSQKEHYKAVSPQRGQMTFIKESEPGKTYVSVLASFNPKARQRPLLAGITLPSELMSFVEGTNYKQVTYDQSRTDANGHPVNGYVQMIVKDRVIEITQVRAEESLAGGVLTESGVATSQIYKDQITIQIDENKKPVSAHVQVTKTMGTPEGKSYTGTLGGWTGDLRF